MSDAADTQTAEPETAPESAPEGGDPTPTADPPSGDTPSVQDYVDDESLSLEDSGLPDATQNEIKKLRKDAKQYRETAQTWSTATQGWQQSDIEQLLTALEAGPDNPQAIGEWMRETAAQLLGEDTVDTQTQTPDPDTDTPDEKLTPDQIKEMVRAEMSQQSQLESQKAKIRAETEELGFGPSHKLHGALLFTAKSNNVSLADAAELLKQAGGVAENETNTPDAPAEAGHTPVPPEGATPAGSQAVRDPKQAMRERPHARRQPGVPGTLSPRETAVSSS